MKGVIHFSFICAVSFLAGCREPKPVVLTVLGPIEPEAMGITLSHEHVMVDFIGADSITIGRHSEEDVFKKVLPYLVELKGLGCETLVEFTPNFLGRNAGLLYRLSKASGLQLLTNTGYYGAVGHKFLPRNTFTETAEELAGHWIAEYEHGIDGTGVRPGFIKLSADKGPLTEIQKKVIRAGALAHLATGLTIAVHSGDGAAASEELAILEAEGVAPEAFIWVHAQNEKDSTIIKKIAEKGAWVAFDGVSLESVDQYLRRLRFMQKSGLLSHTLLSHDAGWYHVGEPEGGSFRKYTPVFENLLPMMRDGGFSSTEIDQVIRKNPAAAFAIRVRKARVL